MYENLAAAMDGKWWAKPEWLAVWLSLAALVIIGLQLWIMGRQTKLMTRQTQLIEKQDEILARRAELVMTAFVRPRSSVTQLSASMIHVEFRIVNHGNKGARNYFWHLYFPRFIRPEMKRGDGTAISGSPLIVADKAFEQYAWYEEKPLYPTRVNSVAFITIPTQPQPLRVEWHIIADDGVFPGKEHGVIDIPLI